MRPLWTQTLHTSASIPLDYASKGYVDGVLAIPDVYGLNLSILWSPLKIWMPKNFTMANFRHCPRLFRLGAKIVL